MSLLPSQKKIKLIERKYKIIEENLTNSERYLSDLKNFVPIPLCYVNIVNVILEINRSFVYFSGYSESEIVSENINKIVRSQISKLIKETIIKNKKVNNIEALFIKKDNNKTPVIISAVPRTSSDGSIMGYFLSFNDVSNIKDIQNKLQKKIKELERFNNLAVGREIKMIEMKKRIKELGG